MSPTPTPWPFVVSLVLLALSAAALLMLLPRLFQDGSMPPAWLLGALAGLAIAGATGTRRLHPSRRGTDH